MQRYKKNINKNKKNAHFPTIPPTAIPTLQMATPNAASKPVVDPFKARSVPTLKPHHGRLHTWD